MTPTRALFASAALALLATVAVPAQAQAQAIYECSGIGLEQREAAENVPHSLRLEFAQPDGHYLGGVETSVTGTNGEQILEVRCPGPWLLLNLPDGRYQISASLGGKTVTRKVSIGGGKRQKQVFIF